MTWLDAQSYCVEELNSSLASLTSDQDVQIVVAIRENSDEYFDKDFWIGFTDSSIVSKEGKWIWIDGTSWYA